MTEGRKDEAGTERGESCRKKTKESVEMKTEKKIGGKKGKKEG